MSAFKESTIGLVFVIILVLFLNPTHLLMPESLNSMLILGLIVFFLMFVAVVWKEKAIDERDAIHIQKTGRLSFLTGTSILLIGIITQATSHEIDVWLLFALLGMVLTKLIARTYQNFKN